ncbi:hypothetical protein BSNK01_12060 [Bacillaceae bacterium]
MRSATLAQGRGAADGWRGGVVMQTHDDMEFRRKARRRRRKKKERYSFRELERMMGVHRPIYERRRGAIRRK